MKRKILLIIGISLIVLLLFKFILFPSYLSVKASCYPEKFEEQYGDTYYIAGQVTVDENQTIKLYVYEEDIPTLKHELCHVNQAQNSRLYSCSNIQLKYLNEAECYFAESYWELKEFIQEII